MRVQCCSKMGPADDYFGIGLKPSGYLYLSTVISLVALFGSQYFALSFSCRMRLCAFSLDHSAREDSSAFLSAGRALPVFRSLGTNEFRLRTIHKGTCFVER